MGIYACPRCGNPNGWWSGNMRDVHDCPGPPRRQWPGQPPELDWAELDEKPTSGLPAVDPAFRHAPYCGARLVTAGECTCGLPVEDPHGY